jgi:hypothetical protein
MNDWCFEDDEMTMVELSNGFLQLSFFWAKVLNISQVSNMQQFVKMCSSFLSLKWWIFLYTSCILELRLSALF